MSVVQGIFVADKSSPGSNPVANHTGGCLEGAGKPLSASFLLWGCL